MRLFLNGGGCGSQAEEAYARLSAIIDHAKPCLYIPLAMRKEKYPSCRKWINEELRGLNLPEIKMVEDAAEIPRMNLNDFSFIFIGGGNTFKLLSDLKTSGAFTTINDFIQNGGIVFGGSAGAIIFGRDLSGCTYADKNEVGLKDIRGFDVLNGISLLCHYDKNTVIPPHCGAVWALEEETTVYINNDAIEIIGNEPHKYAID